MLQDELVRIPYKMAVLSVETSFICEVWHTPDGKAHTPDGQLCTSETPGAKQCGGFMKVAYVSAYSPDLKGKKKMRVCDTCGSERESLDYWLGTFEPKDIDVTKAKNQPVLPGFDD